MRLLFLTETYPPDRGGMSESCDRIVRGLARAGVQLDVVHFDRRCAATSQRPTSFGSLLRVAAEADAAHTINLLWNRVRETANLTHVVAFGGTLPLLAAPAFAAWLGRPLVTLIRGNELDAGLFDPRRRPMLEDALRRSAAICTVTTEQAEKIGGLYGGQAILPVQPGGRGADRQDCLSSTLHVVPNGIDFDNWQPADTEVRRAREWRAANVDPSRRVLGFFGHLKHKKGVPFFVDALRRTTAADRFHLLLVGEIEETPIELPHTLLPPLDRLDLLPYYLASDLVVLPSHYDGFPNVLIEAAALGRTFLASRVGGMRDLLTDGEDAFLFAPGDAHECRDAIERAAAADDATLARMGERAAELARRRCDAREEVHRYVQIFQEVLDAKAALDDDAPSAPRRLSWRAR